MSVEVSVVLTTACNRSLLLEKSLQALVTQQHSNVEVLVVEDGDDGGATREVVERYGALYFQRVRGDSQEWKNPAIPYNIGLRQAHGEFIIHQIGDVRFTRDTDITNLLLPVKRSPVAFVTIASCRRLNYDGTPGAWWVRPDRGYDLLFASGSCFRSDFVRSLGGFDECFTGWGCEDDDLMWRMQRAGAKVVVLPDTLVCSEHLWHPPGNANVSDNKALYEKNKTDILSGRRGLVANVGRDWGQL